MNASDNKPPRAEWAWMDGRFVPWDECKLHVKTQALTFGAAVLEGIRAYWNDNDRQLFVFRLQDHLRRLADSSKIMGIETPFAKDLESVCLELLRRNDFRGDAHMNPFCYAGFAPTPWSIAGGGGADGAFVTATLRPPVARTVTGVQVCVSTWTRISDVVMPPRVKSMSNYQNSRLALMEARRNGYEDVILLNNRGTVAEGAGACVFMVRKGKVLTPPVTAGILESITRDTLIRLFHEKFQLDLVEREVDRTELYLCEEIFYCGSGYEITPIIGVDRIPIGDSTPGRLTKEIQAVYFNVVRGKDKGYAEWRTPVYS